MDKIGYGLVVGLATLGIVTLRGVDGWYGGIAGGAFVGLSAGAAYMFGYLRGVDLS